MSDWPTIEEAEARAKELMAIGRQTLRIAALEAEIQELTCGDPRKVVHIADPEDMISGRSRSAITKT